MDSPTSGVQDIRAVPLHIWQRTEAVATELMAQLTCRHTGTSAIH